MLCAKDNPLTVLSIDVFFAIYFFSFSVQFAFGPKMTISLNKNNSFWGNFYLFKPSTPSKRKHYLQSKINETLLDYNLPKNYIADFFLGYPIPCPPPRLCPLKGRFFCQISEQNWEVPPFPLTEDLHILSQKNFPQKGQKWCRCIEKGPKWT